MENQIALKSIYELLGMNFFIPGYQRGYRWEERQIKELLDDIYTFSQKKREDDEFYCLQPIVVKQCSPPGLESDLDDNRWYEIIDGQQRLISIRLLLGYLVREYLCGKPLEKAYGKPEFKLEFETRPDTKMLMEKISAGEKTDANEYIDFYYLTEAAKTISDWFEGQPQPHVIQGEILNALVTDDSRKKCGVVKIIWYHLGEKDDAIGMFLRTNIGKIPLTNAELVKALFLQKRGADDKLAEIRQIEIANEWDRMEYALQDDEFWYFFNKEESSSSSRIEFLFDFMCKIAKRPEESEPKQIGNDHLATFRFFHAKMENPETNSLTLWNKVKDAFLTLEEWFHNPTWYHYIGYLIYCGNDILEIYDDYKNSSKEDFLKALREKIKKHNYKCNVRHLIKTTEQQKSVTLKEYQIDLHYSNDTTRLRQFLLLFNIEHIVRQGDNAGIRFPFSSFKKESWDIEHIDSYTEHELRDKDSQVKWLEASMADLDFSAEPELKSAIKKFCEEAKNTGDFEVLKKQIIDLAEEETNDDPLKNSIGNLTLLDSHTNRSYRNALFMTKRRRIIERDASGKFIPICTKNVFLKYYDPNTPSLKRWTKDDIQKYQNHIGTILDNYLNITSVES